MTRKLTKEEFIVRAKKVHGEKFDYSIGAYISYHHPYKIICQIHGSFMQSPASHLYGRGCRNCALEKRTENALTKKSIKLKAGLSLKKQCPEIAKEWHPTKNKYVNPKDVLWTEVNKYWWKCHRGHEWNATINNRTHNQSGCPTCGGQSSKFELRVYSAFKSIFRDVIWREKVKGEEADIASHKYKFVVEVDGYWHKDSLKRDRIKNNHFKKLGYRVVRIRDSRNPHLRGNVFLYDNQKVESEIHAINEAIAYLALKVGKGFKNEGQWLGKKRYNNLLKKYPAPPEEISLGSLYPHLLDAWSKNNNLPIKEVWPGSKEVFKWNCLNCKKEFLRDAKSSKGPNGGFCLDCGYKQSGIRRRINSSQENSVALLAKKLVKEWSEENDFTPDQISIGSHYKADWICPKGHGYSASVKDRIRKNNGCPYCSGRKVYKENSLEYLFPILAKEWHPSRNTKKPKEVTKGSGYKAWWQCKTCRKSWEAKVNNRTSSTKSGCPFCAGKRK